MNRNFGKLINNNQVVYAPNAIELKDRVIINPQESDYLANGWKHIDESKPIGPESGYHYEPDGWEETEISISRKWKVVENAKVYRKFSKLKIYGAIIALPDSNGTSAWNKIKNWLESKSINGVNGWMAFELAQEISEEHSMFSALSEEARVLLGLSLEEFEVLLNQCLLGA